MEGRTKESHDANEPNHEKGAFLRSAEFGFIAWLISIGSFGCADVSREQYGFIPEVMALITFCAAHLEFFLKSLPKPPDQ